MLASISAIEGQLRDLLDEIAATLPPLRGVVHAAGVLDDGLVDQLSADRFRTVMRGKVEGARLLDRLTAGASVGLSSCCSPPWRRFWGRPVRATMPPPMLCSTRLRRTARRADNLDLSIAWGPWAEIGLAAAQANRGARLAERGLASLSLDEGRRLFRRLAGGAQCVSAMRFDPARWLDVAAPSTTTLFGEILGDGSGATAPSPAQMGKGVGAAAVKDLVIGQLADVLRTSPDRVAGDRPFRALGLDSLMGLELRNRLERVLGLKLSASTVWNFPTANQLCAYLATRMAGSGSSSAPASTQFQPEHDSARALEDELLEANALLAEL